MAVAARLYVLAATVMVARVVAVGAEEFGASEMEKSLQMSEAEVTSRMKALFAIIDTNEDGKLTKEEVKTFAESGLKGDDLKQAEMEFKSLDADGDGKVSLEEMSTAFSNEEESGPHDIDTRFRLVDKNQDGSLSVDEVALLMNPGLVPELLELEIDEVLKSQDKNEDGGIDFTEFLEIENVTDAERAEYESEFKMYDTDANGIVSRSEIEKVIRDTTKGEVETNVSTFFEELKTDEITEELMLSNLHKFAVSFITDSGEMLRFPDDYSHLNLPFQPIEPRESEDESDVHEEL